MKTDFIIDSHCHIYPDKIAEKAVTAINTFYEEISDRIQNGTVGTLIRTGKEQGISHFIVHSVATTPRQVSSINHFIADCVRHSGGAFTGLGTLHLDSTDIRRDLDELCSLGLKGVKLHPDIQKFTADAPRAMDIYEMCEDRGLPVLVHTGDYRYDYSNPPRIAYILRTFPKLKFIGAHFGGWSVWEEAGKILPDYPNITVDTSSSSFALRPQKMLELIRAYGSERVMFGTDYPLWTQKPELDYIDQLDLTQEERENIAWRTCRNMYDISL